MTLPHLPSRLKILSSILYQLTLLGIYTNSMATTIDTCIDTEKPVITIYQGTCSPAHFDRIYNSCTGFLSLYADATDDQTMADHLLYEYKIDLYNDHQGPLNGFDYRVGPLTAEQFKNGIKPSYALNEFAIDKTDPIHADGKYPLGEHRICWDVTDSCGNTAQLCELFVIRDCEAPTQICKTGTQFFTLPKSGSITLYAKDFDAGSYDNCSSPDELIYFFNGKVEDTSITVTCDDFAASGACYNYILPVQLWVQDKDGDNTYCNIEIKIFDITHVCPHFTDGSILLGRVQSIFRDSLFYESKNFDTRLYTNSILKVIELQNPFSIECLVRINYNLNIIKNTDSLNSVNTYDLFLLQKALNNIDTFTDAYQKTTADVNVNGSIDIDDYFEIKNLILGTTTGFSKSNPWKILVTSFDNKPVQTFVDTFSMMLGELRNYPLESRCFKMGDVNDYITPAGYKLLNTNHHDSLILKIQNQSIKKGQLIQLDVKVSGFKNIVGFQGSFQFDFNKLNYLDVKPGAILMISNCIGTKFISQGYLTFSWNELYKTTIADSSILFHLIFETIDDGDLCNIIQLNSSLTPAEAYTDENLIKNFQLLICDVKTETDNKNTLLNSKLYPNPAGNFIKIELGENIHLPIDLQLYDSNSNLIRSNKLYQNNTSINTQDLLPGIYYIRLKNANASRSDKFVRM